MASKDRLAEIAARKQAIEEESIPHKKHFRELRDQHLEIAAQQRATSLALHQLATERAALVAEEKLILAELKKDLDKKTAAAK